MSAPSLDLGFAPGWQRRVLGKLGGAATAGALAGVLMGLSRGSPPARFAAATAGSCSLAAATFASLQEATRAARGGADTPLNSGLAGGLAAATLVRAHTGSPGRSAASALACAAAAAGAHAAWGSHGWVRAGLRRAGLVDETAAERAARVEGEAAAAAAAVASSKDVEPLPWFLAWLPGGFIRRMSPEEAAAHKAAKKAGFRDAVQAAAEGGLPAAVEGRRRRDREGESGNKR